MATDFPDPAPEPAILAQQVALENGYFAARFMAPKTASRARPGQRLVIGTHLVAAQSLFLMRANDEHGWVEVLYRADTAAWTAFSQHPRASACEVRLDESTAWELPAALGHVVVLADQAHLAAAVFLADDMRKRGLARRCLILLELYDEPPFRPRPSHILVQGMPPGVIAAMPLLEDWSVPSRLASRMVRPGCFEGPVASLALYWLRSSNPVPDDLVLATAGIDRASMDELSQQVDRVFPITYR